MWLRMNSSAMQPTLISTVVHSFRVIMSNRRLTGQSVSFLSQSVTTSQCNAYDLCGNMLMS